MPFAAIPAVASVGLSAYEASQAGGGGYGGPTAYQPTGQGAADTQFQQGTQAFAPFASSIPQSVIPAIQGAAGKLSNNPYAQIAQNAANTGGGYGVNTLAPEMQAGANALFSAGNQALQTGFDP